jgi:hypothetical protein
MRTPSRSRAWLPTTALAVAALFGAALAVHMPDHRPVK